MMKNGKLLAMSIGLLVVGGGMLAAGARSARDRNFYIDSEMISEKLSNISSNFEFGDSDNVVTMVEIQTVEVSEDFNIEDISEMYISSELGDVEIISGDVFEILGGSVNSLSDGKLNIDFKPVNKENIMLGSGDNKLTIVIPDGYSFANINIANNLGNLTVNDLNADNIDIAISGGNGEINNIICDNLNLNISTSICRISSVNLDNINITNSLGELTFDILDGTNANVISKGGTSKFTNSNMDNLTLDNKVGELSYSGIIDSSVELNANGGSVNLSVNDDISNYNVAVLSNSMSEISVDGKSYDKYKSESSEGGIPIKINASMSEVSITG